MTDEEILDKLERLYGEPWPWWRRAWAWVASIPAFLHYGFPRRGPR